MTVQTKQTVSNKKALANKRVNGCGFQNIPHWNDPEIGYKALLKCIKIYVSYKHDEFERLAPVISKDEFIWDTFSNMCRRNGYPQYNKEKNKGNFYSFVQTCCIRNQADWARKRNTKATQLAELQGKTIRPENHGHPEYYPILNLDEFIVDSDDQTKHEKILGSNLDVYTEKLAMEEISRNISTEKISEKFRISWKEFAELLMKGWSVVDISKELEVNPTTTRKYFGLLKEKMLQDSNIQEMLKLSGITVNKKA